MISGELRIGAVRIRVLLIGSFWHREASSRMQRTWQLIDLCINTFQLTHENI